MKTLVVGICIIVVVAVWFGGWYVYEDYELINEFSPSKFQNLLMGGAGFGVVFVILFSVYYSKKARILKDAQEGLRQTPRIKRKKTENPNLKILSDKLDNLHSVVTERLDSLESQIEDIGIARALEPKKKRDKK